MSKPVLLAGNWTPDTELNPRAQRHSRKTNPKLNLRHYPEPLNTNTHARNAPNTAKKPIVKSSSWESNAVSRALALGGGLKAAEPEVGDGDVM